MLSITMVEETLEEAKTQVEEANAAFDEDATPENLERVQRATKMFRKAELLWIAVHDDIASLQKKSA